MVPQHSVLFVDGDVVVFSGFDSGNLASVKKVGPSHYECTVAPDCAGTDNEAAYTTWFHFGVRGCEKGATLTFSLTNLNVQSALYTQQMVPVHRSLPSMHCYTRIPGRVTHVVAKDQSDMKITFPHTFLYHREEVYFAFAYPYSFAFLQQSIAEWKADHPIPHHPDAEDIHFVRDTLALTLEGRPLDLLTITDHHGWAPRPDPVPTPRRYEEFPGKRVVVLSARVHPGETPASHMMHGLIEFLLGSDPRAKAARQHFVFQVIPMLNPDGVYRGHYRTDTLGANLNRCYIDPNPAREPAVHALKALLLDVHRSGQLALYVDMHGHATRRGAFMYGNAVPEAQSVDMLLYPKLVSLNTPYFDFAACNFTEKNMVSRSKRDGNSKEGSSRVNLFQETGFIHCYTLEANYNTMMITNRMTNIDLDLRYPVMQVDALPHAFPEHFPQSFVGLVPKYIPQMYHDVGRALVVSVLDMFSLNPWSRLPFTSFQSVSGLRGWVERNARLMQEPPHKVKNQASQNLNRLALQETGASTRSVVHRTGAVTLVPPAPLGPQTTKKAPRAAKEAKKRPLLPRSSSCANSLNTLPRDPFHRAASVDPPAHDKHVVWPSPLVVSGLAPAMGQPPRRPLATPSPSMINAPVIPATTRPPRLPSAVASSEKLPGRRRISSASPSLPHRRTGPKAA